MSFTDIVQRKIKERRTGPSPKALAQVARDKRFRLLATQVINALEALRDRLFEDPLFADVIGRPDVGVEPWDEEGEDGATLKLKGRLATFSIMTDIKRDRFSFRIYPDMPTTEALGCSLAAGYSPDSGMRGRSTSSRTTLPISSPMSQRLLPRFCCCNPPPRPERISAV